VPGVERTAPSALSTTTPEGPSSWNVFIKFKERVTRTELAKASRYRARLQLAIGFRDLPLANVSIATAESYFVLVKLALAYSALEALESLTGKNSVRVTDKLFHHALCQGQFEQLIQHLIAAAKDQRRPTDEELAKYMGLEAPQDLTPIVKHSRHAVFHASATPNSLKLQSSPERRRLLLGLANSTLAACENSFDRFVSSIKQRPKHSVTKPSTGASRDEAKGDLES